MAHPSVVICRICLSNDELQVSLFSAYAQRKLLLTKIRVCLPIKITHADTLPVTICNQCIVRLDQFYEYYCKSETSQRILNEGTSAVHRRKPNTNVHQDNTLSTNVDTSLMRTTIPTNGNGSITVSDRIDPILTQSPKVDNTSANNEETSRHTISPGQTLSFLLKGQKEKHKRQQKNSTKKHVFASF